MATQAVQVNSSTPSFGPVFSVDQKAKLRWHHKPGRLQDLSPEDKAAFTEDMNKYLTVQTARRIEREFSSAEAFANREEVYFLKKTSEHAAIENAKAAVEEYASGFLSKSVALKVISALENPSPIHRGLCKHLDQLGEQKAAGDTSKEINQRISTLSSLRKEVSAMVRKFNSRDMPSGHWKRQSGGYDELSPQQKATAEKAYSDFATRWPAKAAQEPLRSWVLSQQVETANYRKELDAQESSDPYKYRPVPSSHWQMQTGGVAGLSEQQLKQAERQYERSGNEGMTFAAFVEAKQAARAGVEKREALSTHHFKDDKDAERVLSVLLTPQIASAYMRDLAASANKDHVETRNLFNTLQMVCERNDKNAVTVRAVPLPGKRDDMFRLLESARQQEVEVEQEGEPARADRSPGRSKTPRRQRQRAVAHSR